MAFNEETQEPATASDYRTGHSLVVEIYEDRGVEKRDDREKAAPQPRPLKPRLANVNARKVVNWGLAVIYGILVVLALSFYLSRATSETVSHLLDLALWVDVLRLLLALSC